MRNFVLDNASEQERRLISRAGGDRRASPREEVKLPALLVRNDDETFACTIVDRSRDGFRLMVADEVAVPDQFLLVDILGGIGHEAQIAWRDGGFIGARSLTRHDLHEPQAGLGAILKRAWTRALT
ncbi:PilZ domain-containing protein [Phenylobacterium sp.]|uniref:PilZ domain-containing protein n=1 Tax=Phenylobacterium sp. TaxID=1871053 RepID=UPI002869FB7C|nr:PilZ domain-containing protein [Phenylobacterium sp.]